MRHPELEMFREVQLHQGEWYCDGCSMYFSQNTLFQEHMKAEHSNLVITEDFEAIMSRCERTIVTDIECPLCGIKFNLQALENHLGHHLQEVALFTLLDPVKGGNKSKSKKVGHSSGEHLSIKTGSGFGLSSNPLVEDQPISKSKREKEVYSSGRPSRRTGSLYSNPLLENLSIIKSKKEKEVYSSGKHLSRKTGSGFGLYSNPLVEDQPISKSKKEKEVYSSGNHSSRKTGSGFGLYSNPLVGDQPISKSKKAEYSGARNTGSGFGLYSNPLAEDQPIISPVSAKEIRCMGLHLQKVAPSTLPNPVNKEKSAKVGYFTSEHLSRNASPKFNPDSKRLMENPPIISPVSAKEIRCMMVSGQS